MTPELLNAFYDYRRERADELYEIARLLESAGVTTDATPIRNAATQCQAKPRIAGPKQPDAGATYWGYEISDQRVEIETQRHCRPRNAVMENVTAFLSVTVHEYVPPDLESVRKSYSLLRRLDTDFYFDAYHEIDGTRQPLRAAWHVDTHLHTSTASASAHPRFHFQVGGERFDEYDELIRGVFVPETPRLPCAPMDAPLALDFILAHYCGSIWDVLCGVEARYVRLRQTPMQRYWAPYFRTLSDSITDLDHDPTGGAAKVLNPSVCSVT